MSEASSGHRFCSAPLAGLEPEGSSAGLHVPSSPSACRGPGRGWEWQGRCHTPCHSCAGFPGRAFPFSSHVGTTIGPQCASRNVREGHNSAVRCSPTLCHHARVGRSLTDAPWFISVLSPQIRLSAWRSLCSILCYLPSSLFSDCHLSVSVPSNTEESRFRVISASPNHI